MNLIFYKAPDKILHGVMSGDLWVRRDQFIQRSGKVSPKTPSLTNEIQRGVAPSLAENCLWMVVGYDLNQF